MSGETTQQPAGPVGSIVNPGLLDAPDSGHVSPAGTPPPEDDFDAIEHQPLTDGSKGTYLCTICKKRYERLDHARRHLASHSNTRPFCCDQCPRRFNRQDLLTRHRQCHDNPAARGRNGARLQRSGRASAPRERAIHACQACVTSKARCDNSRPCQRCRARNRPCEEAISEKRYSLHRRPSQGGSAPSIVTEPRPPPAEDLESTPVTDVQHRTESYPGGGVEQNQQSTNLDAWIPGPEIEMNDYGLTEHLLSNHDKSWDMSVLMQGDLSNIFRDIDFHFDDFPASVSSEQWIPPMDWTFGDSTLDTDTDPAAASYSIGTVAGHNTQPERVTSSYEAFKRSPWLWTPMNQDHAYAEQAQLAVNDDHQILSSPEATQDSAMRTALLPTIKSDSTRDHVLAIVLEHVKSGFRIGAFPSRSVLSVLLQAFLVRDGSSAESIIHRATFNPDSCRTELLAAVISAGSTLFAAPNTWKMGLALQEIVKLAICDAVDHDNRLVRNVQAVQTFLLWIEIGLWSGFRRKMEIGEGFASTVPTMLRRAGAFHANRYSSDLFPNPSDEGEALEEKWRAWVEQESLRRLVFRVFINEMRSSMALVRSPVFSTVDLTLAFPGPRSLWDASTAQEWKVRSLALDSTGTQSTLNIIDAMQNVSRLEVNKQAIDIELSILATFHAFWGQVRALHDFKTLHSATMSRASRASRLLWLDMQHEELFRTIQDSASALAKAGLLAADAALVVESLLMCLHVNPDHVQRFAGKFGEDDSHLVVPALRDWAAGSNHAHAVWHAGQVLRVAQTIAPTQLRGFSAIGVYHACLTLLTSITIKQHINTASSAQHQNGPVGHNPSGDVDAQNLVVLNGEESPASRAFIATGVGDLALQLGNQVYGIRNKGVVANVLQFTFRNNFPARDSALPPLLESLSSLMHDLCKATPLG